MKLREVVKIKAVYPDDPGLDIPDCREAWFTLAMPIEGIHFKKGGAMPLRHPATQKWHIGGKIKKW